MSLLIKGMEMPKNCAECPLCEQYDFYASPYCRVSDDDDFMSINEIRKQRRENCPLVPVPPHYDLIDHNALKIAVMDGDCETRLDFLKHTMKCINNAPVVIPSDIRCLRQRRERHERKRRSHQ